MTWMWNIRKCTQILSVCVPTEKVLSMFMLYYSNVFMKKDRISIDIWNFE